MPTLIEPHLLNVIFMHIVGPLGSLMERELERAELGTSLLNVISLRMMNGFGNFRRR